MKFAEFVVWFALNCLQPFYKVPGILQYVAVPFQAILKNVTNKLREGAVRPQDRGMEVAIFHRILVSFDGHIEFAKM